MNERLDEVLQLCHTYPEKDAKFNTEGNIQNPREHNHRLNENQVSILRDWNPGIDEYFRYYFNPEDHWTKTPCYGEKDNYEGWSIPVYYPNLKMILFVYNYYGSYGSFKSWGQVTDLSGKEKDITELLQNDDFSDGTAEEQLLTTWLKKRDDFYPSLGKEKYCIILRRLLPYHENKRRRLKEEVIGR